ncbi:hypothetical protein [Streptomyces vietnamensis]|uniref:hypothetical protein n=1 Tax=Streptomyces vietnamensis TaxID=362257 RepID=UPI00131E86A9|nr:hypothetical protein [Streptomyces vietnamensis]
MNLMQIARQAGVGRAAVVNWRRRHDDFPQPAVGTPFILLTAPGPKGPSRSSSSSVAP